MKGMRGTHRFYVAVNIIFVLLLAAGFIVMPPFADDLWYYQDIYAARQEGASGLAAACNTVVNHYLCDNGRLSNVAFSFSLLLPRWIGSLFAACVFGGALLLAYRLIARFSHRRTGFLTVVSVISLCGLALPWYDYLYQQCYQFNYLISTGISMLAIYLVLFSTELKKCRQYIIAFFLVGTVAGGWHEGFGVPLLSGIIVLLIFRSEYRNYYVVSLLAGLITGIIWVLASPAALARIGGSGSLLSQCVAVMMLHPVFLLLLISCFILVLKKELHKVLSSPLVIIMVVSALMSLAIHLASVRAPRAGWWCEFASVVLIGYMAAISVKRVGKTVKVAGALLLAVTLIKLTVCDVYAWRYREQYSGLVSDYRDSSDGVVFIDFIPEYASPLIAWMAPSFHLYYDRYQRWMFAECYGDETKQPVIIPSGLKDVTWSDGRPVDGNIPVRRFGDFYLCRQEDFEEINDDDTAREGEINGRLKIGPVTLKSARVFYFFFENDRGEELVLLLPWRVFPISPLFEIESISI